LIERLKGPAGSDFDTKQWKESSLKTLSGSRGHIAHLGHLNLALAAWHYLGGDNRYQTLFKNVSESIARRIEASPFLNAETYPQEIYPMDNVAALASLVLFERWTHNRASPTAERWVRYAKAHLLDPKTGLVVHALNSKGQSVQAARGCSTAWYSFFLPIIDPDFAKDQYARMLEYMGSRRLGVYGIREYPHGIPGSGDVDSGPLVLGLSPSASGFAIGGARWQRDTVWLDRLLFTSELVGSSVQWKGQRWYLLSPLVGEAIMLSMRTMTPWDNRYKPYRT